MVDEKSSQASISQEAQSNLNAVDNKSQSAETTDRQETAEQHQTTAKTAADPINPVNPELDIQPVADADEPAESSDRVQPRQSEPGGKQSIEQSAEFDKKVDSLQAKSTSVIQNHAASIQPVEAGAGESPGVAGSSNGEVRIGQVDVFVERTSTPAARANSSSRPSVSLASRHYLGRL